MRDRLQVMISQKEYYRKVQMSREEIINILPRYLVLNYKSYNELTAPILDGNVFNILYNSRFKPHVIMQGIVKKYSDLPKRIRRKVREMDYYSSYGEVNGVLLLLSKELYERGYVR